MQDVGIDFETFYDVRYSLKQINYTDYVADDRFQVYGAALKFGDEPAQFVWMPELKAILDSIDWKQTRLYAHNMNFDGYVLDRVFGHHPAQYFCTLMASDALLQGACASSLEAVGQYLFKEGKRDGLAKVKGIRLEDLTDELKQELSDYAIQDMELSHRILAWANPQLPFDEQEIMDFTIRAFCQPVLRIDKELAIQVRDRARAETEAKVAATGLDESLLRSNIEFAAEMDKRLAKHGESMPMKPGKKGDIPALAKTDEGMHWLLDHKDADIRALAEARLAVKSRLEETRADRFVRAADAGPFGCCYKYYSAHTGRWGGSNKMNPQNLPRGHDLRRCIMAPEGHVLVAGDLSQIEARMNAWHAGQEDLLEVFRDPTRDPYNEMAEEIYGVSVDRKNEAGDPNWDPIDEERGFVGKTVVLGCGYQMGWNAFQAQMAAGAMGRKMTLDDEFCANIIRVYRAKNDRIVSSWSEAQDWIRYLIFAREPMYTERGLILVPQEKKILLPNGMFLFYPGLTSDRNGDFVYTSKDQVTGRIELHKLYGGKLIENIIQALSRIVIASQMLTLHRLGFYIAMTTHDELVTPVEEEDEPSIALIKEVMHSVPDWCKDLPVAAEFSIDQRYAK